MTSKVVTLMSVLLGAIFIFFGCLKLTPKISSDLHIDLKQEFVKYARVIPVPRSVIRAIFGRSAVNKKGGMSPRLYRQTIGWMEIIFGAILLLVPHRRIRNWANVLLVLIKLGHLHAHYAISDPFERTAPSLVFTLLLCCRLVVDWQISRRNLNLDDIVSSSRSEQTVPSFRHIRRHSSDGISRVHFTRNEDEDVTVSSRRSRCRKADD